MTTKACHQLLAIDQTGRESALARRTSECRTCVSCGSRIVRCRRFRRRGGESISKERHTEGIRVRAVVLEQRVVVGGHQKMPRVARDKRQRHVVLRQSATADGRDPESLPLRHGQRHRHVTCRLAGTRSTRHRNGDLTRGVFGDGDFTPPGSPGYPPVACEVVGDRREDVIW